MANTVFNIRFRMTGISIPLLAVDITGRRLMMTSHIYIDLYRVENKNEHNTFAFQDHNIVSVLFF